MRTEEAITIRREDYAPPSYLADTIELEFDLDPERTLVTATTRFRRNPDGSGGFALDGDALELVEIAIDGRLLHGDEYSCNPRLLQIKHVPEQFTLRLVTAIAPRHNTELMGLYVSSDNFLPSARPRAFGASPISRTVRT